jgi:hypothetical protein
MAWIKQGLILKPNGNKSSNSHLQVPTVLVKDDCLRVYYAGRFQSGEYKGNSYTSYVDLDLNDFKNILYHHKKPIISFGKPGTFDDEGIMPSEVIQKGDNLLLYYSGWNKRVTIPYHNATGVAVSKDGGASFERIFDGPILDRIATEPYLAVTPSILIENNEWKMWYISGLRWVKIKNKFEPVYAIKYATSTDGFNWDRKGNICIPQSHEFEAFSRPSVIKYNNIYRMWFCCRDSIDYRDGIGSYRMGYAESINGVDWKRLDNLSEIDLSTREEDWDSKMICYPYVKKIKNSIYMFYNGNGFGQSGFGYAKWIE